MITKELLVHVGAKGHVTTPGNAARHFGKTLGERVKALGKAL